MKLAINKKYQLVKAKLKERDFKVILPDNIVSIGESVFANNAYLREIILPSGVEDIGENSFYNCSNLREIIIPDSVKFIENGAFEKCINLSNVKLSSSLDCVRDRTFCFCSSLERIDIPSSVKVIGEYAFNGTNIKSIEFKEGLEEIHSRAFSKCVNLEELVLPSSIKKIDSLAFYSCEKLKKITMPSNVKVLFSYAFDFCSGLEECNVPYVENFIGEGIFYDCYKLKKVTFNPSFDRITKNFFKNCKSLESIELPPLLKCIEEYSFSKCISLKKISIPEGVQVIENGVFYDCDNLEKVVLPNSIIGIKKDAFYNCKNLRKINIPSSVEIISTAAFGRCLSLSKIVIPCSVKKIEERSFSLCSNLKEISINSSDCEIENGAFTTCENIEVIKLKNFKLLKQKGLNDVVNRMNYYYFNDETGELVIRKDFVTLKNFRRIKVHENICSNWSKADCVIFSIIFGEELLSKMGDLNYILPYIVYDVFDSENFVVVRENLKNNKEFNNLIKRIQDNICYVDVCEREEEFYGLFKFASCLGAFDSDFKNRQRACEFIINAFDKEFLGISLFYGGFDYLKGIEFNAEWASFVMSKDNFKRISREEKRSKGFIEKTYNCFDEIKEFYKSNKGNQHYRKVTFDMCKEFLDGVNFMRVNETNVDISKEIAKYTKEQKSFDAASEIRNEYLELKETGRIDDHLIKEELKEKVFEDIERCKKSIISNTISSIMNLKEIANNRITYEFLSKYDASNFVLGKYCDCCAHLEGFGFSVMKASIVHPDCQNIVIRTRSGRIISKSTLYINRKEGYGVLNTISVKGSVDKEVKRKIYLKYMEALSSFSKRYNELNPSRPLKQINVGMGMNDLTSEIVKNNDKASDILEGLDFSCYGEYEEDWASEQYVMWKITNNKVRK